MTRKEIRNIAAGLVVLVGLSLLAAAGAQLAVQALADPAVPVVVAVDPATCELPTAATLGLAPIRFPTRAV